MTTDDLNVGVVDILVHGVAISCLCAILFVLFTHIYLAYIIFRFLGKIMQAFHEEIQRRLDAEANLRRQLAQAHRRLKANARKAARKEDESKLAYARQSNVIRHLNFSLNEAHLQIQELQRQDRSAFLRGRVRGGRLRRGGKKSSGYHP